MDHHHNHRGSHGRYEDDLPQARRPSRPSIQTGITGSRMVQTQITPPETPVSPQDGANPPAEQQTLFHNYLRAFHPFDPLSNPSTSSESLLMTASIKPGDMILVHSIHANGWADATVLTTGERGWIPTNYCEAYDHPYLRNLLNAMTQFWDLLGANEDANLSAFIRQDYIRGLIAGVRYLLDHADCLHRGAAVVQRHAAVRRMRKGLLAELSSLVKIAKRLQETISEPFASEVVHVLLDDLIAKAFKVVTRATGFLDVWTLEAGEVKTSDQDSKNLRDPFTRSTESHSLAIHPKALFSGGHKQAVDSENSFKTQSPEGLGAEDAVLGAREEADISQSVLLPLSGVFKSRNTSVAHRLSRVESDHRNTSKLASEQLAKQHDVCISHIGAFIGHHLQSRSSAELARTTDRLVQACNSMLAILEKVYSYDAQRSVGLQQARINFQVKLDELIKLTKDGFGFSDSDENDVFMLPEQSNHLINVVTSLVRTAGECVTKTRSIIEQIGDFELGDRQSLSSKENTTAIRDNTEIEERSKSSFEGRLSKQVLPSPPSARLRTITTTDTFDFALSSFGEGPEPTGSMAQSSPPLHKSLPPPLIQRRSTIRTSGAAFQGRDIVKSPRSFRTSSGSPGSPGRKSSVGDSIAGSTDTHGSSTRDSGTSAVSEVSTRATTPDQTKETSSPDPALLTSFASLSSIRSVTTDTDSEGEMRLLQRTYASELTLNRDGQVSGGSLPALVEQLTTHDSTPDPQFVSAFYLTFRMFTTPRDLAYSLIARFDYVGDSKQVGTPVRLRIYNVFKGWLETYWNAELDKDALGDIRYFALHKLKPHLPSAGERLVELTRRVSAGYHTGTITGPLVSGVGKTSTSIGSQDEANGHIPDPIISRSQLNALRSGASCSILDFDPLELARQFTLMTSRIFCEIQPDELLSLEWGKNGTQSARNVRSMCTVNTDLAHVVGDTVLAPEDAKKRALVIKHWSKIGVHCLELNNYDSLMAIMCSVNSSVVSRLKRTWELVSKKTKTRLTEMNAVVDYSRNHASLRRRLETSTAPCLPFLGIYLTDLTFVDAGNPKTRELPGRASENGEKVCVINFDKHMRMARIISHLQKFQVPYKLQAVPEMQAWIDTHLHRMRQGNDEMVRHFHRRSLVIEPKQDDTKAAKFTDAEERPKIAGNKEKIELFLKTNAFNFRQLSRTETPTTETREEQRPEE